MDETLPPTRQPYQPPAVESDEPVEVTVLSCAMLPMDPENCGLGTQS